MKNTIITIAILLAHGIFTNAQTTHYNYDSNGNRIQQQIKSCSEDPKTTKTQRIILEKGWNLISTYIQPSDYSKESVFASILPDLLKVKNQENSFDPKIADDFNTLKEIKDGEGYLVNMKQAATLAITGKYNNQNNTKISLEKGWNLIGYPFAKEQDVETAFARLMPNLEKVKSSFESYDPNIAPAFNTLSKIEPGKAYWVKVKEAIDFIYPKPSATGRSVPNTYIAQRNEQSKLTNWQPVAYPASMIAYGQVTLDGKIIEGIAMIGTFVQDECRATALVKTEGEKSISSMVINGKSDETIEFVLYQDGQIYHTKFTTKLNSGKIPSELLPLAFTSEHKEKNNFFPITQISPNPFVSNLNIQLNLPEANLVTLQLYDATGRKIARKDLGKGSSGVQQIHWNLEDYQNTLSRGIYFLEIKTNTGVFTKKVIYQP